jgi:hypothetical protein
LIGALIGAVSVWSLTQASTLTSAIEDARKAKVAQGKIDEANACLEKLEGQGKAAEVCLTCA